MHGEGFVMTTPWTMAAQGCGAQLVWKGRRMGAEMRFHLFKGHARYS